eukprot:TRINITY_DN20137_c0_g2_i1.p1 TRINITY_DN20137_c0_g2~~TRINITY_DN20137_c0_g2_i1.p1  ORF type:complete len:322 (-),score=83.11 TRINITY_DN20137_c0_g2_i1:123-1088(-)
MAGRYVNEEGGESERPLKVCAEAGRKCVRNIHQYPVLSAEWIVLVDSLRQLTRLVQLEGRMPNNPKVLETAGRDQESEGTLWDQENHENAIRILVEEAKVNLCLRMMNDFKVWQAGDKRASIEEAMKAYEYTENQLEQKCLQFEESLGLLLLRAFTHVETLQLMDIPLLIEHCAMIFTHAKNMCLDNIGDSRLQEVVVLSYFASLMKHAEALTGELLAKSRDLLLVNLAVVHYLQHADKLSATLKVTLAEGLAALADNEDFRTNWQDHLVDESSRQPSPEAKQNFLALDEALVAPILAEKPDYRSVLRPLTDFFREIKRNM